jgi:hypothetical protein
VASAADRHRVAPGKWSEIRTQPDAQGRMAPAHALMSDRGYTQPLEAARNLAASPGEPTFEPRCLVSSASGRIAGFRRGRAERQGLTPLQSLSRWPPMH